MKKSIFFLILFFAFTTGLFAQNQILTVGNNSNLMNETVLMLQNDNQTTIRFDLNQLELVEVETDYGIAHIPISNKAPLMLQEGSPELFYLATSFIIPDKGDSKLEISYGQFQDFENIEIAPSKGNLLRSIDPNTVPFVKGDVYQIDGFFPGTLASLGEPFIMRDVRGQSVDVYPIQYNPVTKILRVYSEITISVINTRTEGINEFTIQKRHKTVEPAFNEMYHNLFINYSSLSRAYPTEEEGELLIICHPAFMDDMKPYIDWKRTIGRKTTMVSTATTGTTYQAIKTYIQDYYSNPAHNLAYVLLVGDVAQIPVYSYNASGETCYSDIYYAQLESGVYLDILIGRMSAENVTHVQTQVQRSIWYERDLTPADTWLSKAIGLAANEGPAGSAHNNEYDYTHMNNIRNRLLDYGYNPVYQEYSNGAGVPNTTTAQISSRFNEGMGMANYCNHGDTDGWYLTQGYSYISFTNTQVNQLQNAGKLPYIFSVACLNGKFPNTTCFAEAWMRATKDGQPTGAVATMMATISISWAPPMTANDEFVNICLDLPPYIGQAAGIKRTFAGASLNATQKMRMQHGASANHDYNSWTVFGDPTLMFRTKTPETMTISHLPTIPFGMNEFSVDCNTEGATATLSYIDDNNEVVILGTAAVSEGVAEIVFDEPITEFVELTLAVTGFNKVTYLSAIVIGDAPELFAPENLTFTVEKANHVILNWDEPNADKSLTVKGYNIYRDNERVNLELIKDETSFTDITPANGEYKYEVTAFYGTTLESDPSNSVMVLIDGMCVPISDFTVEETKEIIFDVEIACILVSWETPEYEGTELAGYNVYRDDVKINFGIIPATELSYLDENLEYGVRYCYQIEVVYNDCEEVITEKECHTLSITELPGAQTFQIFPNPASSELNIAGNVVPTYVCIYNNMGQLMYDTDQCAENMKITVSNLHSGIYFIRIDSEQGSVTKKVVVSN